MGENKKIIAVAGATGAQGGSLVRAILEDPKGGFVARALTRNPASEKAKALAKQGVEVVRADLDDPASLERAFQGAYGAYCVTFYWAHMDPEREIANARALANAARKANVKHVIWSTLEDTRDYMSLDDDRMPTLMGKYKVPHYDCKGETDKVFKELDLPVTLLRTSFYWDNFIHFGLEPKKGPDGKLAITFPLGDKRMPGIAAEDIGRCAYAIFKHPQEYLGKTLGIAGGKLTGAQMAASMSRALGREIVYNDVPPEVFRGFGFPGADDTGNMFQFKRDFEEQYCGNRDIDLARKLNPGLLSFDDWLAKHKSEIPLG